MYRIYVNWDEWTITNMYGYNGGDRWDANGWEVELERVDTIGVSVDIVGDAEGYKLRCYRRLYTHVEPKTIYYVHRMQWGHGISYELTPTMIRKFLVVYSSDPLV
jgi:hypothetical protein